MSSETLTPATLLLFDATAFNQLSFSDERGKNFLQREDLSGKLVFEQFLFHSLSLERENATNPDAPFYTRWIHRRSEAETHLHMPSKSLAVIKQFNSIYLRPV